MDIMNVLSSTVEITGKDKDLIGDALDYYQSCQIYFVSYDEHVKLVKQINDLKDRIGIL